MRQLITTAALVLLAAAGAWAQVSQAEYFFDTDPGVGNGTPLSITQGDAISETAALPIGALTPGNHWVHVRVRATNGRWSHYESRMFNVEDPTAQPVIDRGQPVVAEYFFDTDPGVGNGTPLSITPGTSIDETSALPIGALAPGNHWVHVRIKGADGLWSHYESRMFNVEDPTAQPVIDRPELVSGEYFFNTDPGIGNGTAFSIAAADSVTMPLAITEPGLPLGTHWLFLRIRNTDGTWSHYEAVEFEICGSVVQGTANIELQSGSAVICAGQTNAFEATLTNEGATPAYEWQLNGSVVSSTSTYSAPSSLQTGDELTLAVISSESCVDPNPLRDTLAIVVTDTVFTTEDVTICDGASYELPNGSTVSLGGEYISYLSAVNTCDSVVTTNLTVDICTGLDDAEAVGFLLYPNPNNGQFVIEGSSADYTIDIYNNMGQLIHSQLAVEQRTELNLQQQPSGIYHVSVTANEDVSRFKVIKQ